MAAAKRLFLCVLLISAQSQAQSPAAFLQDISIPQVSSLRTDVIYKGKDIADEPLNDPPHFFAVIEATSTRGTTTCSGMAISPDVVLTAGHCLVNKVRVSVKFIKKINPLKYETIRAAAWKHHPGYNGFSDGPLMGTLTLENTGEFHDIGVIVLRSPSKYAKPLPLVPADFDPSQGNPLMFVFGRGRAADYKLNDHLEFLEVHTPQHWGDSDLMQGQLQGGQAWCVGDSGGPVTVSAESEEHPGQKQHYLVGVAFVMLNAFRMGTKERLLKAWESLENVPSCGRTVAFTRVAPMVPWIQQTLEEIAPGRTPAF